MLMRMDSIGYTIFSFSLIEHLRGFEIGRGLTLLLNMNLSTSVVWLEWSSYHLIVVVNSHTLLYYNLTTPAPCWMDG